jgi:hypothetical protein
VSESWTEQQEDHALGLVELHQASMLRKLESVKGLLVDAGFVCDGPTILDSGIESNYVSLVVVGHSGQRWDEEKSIDISYEVAFQCEYEGPAEATGLNFSCSVVESGGRIVGGLTPFNYTDQVWVDMGDEDAVRERWQLLDSADEACIVDLIERHVMHEPGRHLSFYRVRQVSDHWEVRARHPEAKQAIWGWAGSGGPEVELYGDGETDDWGECRWMLSPEAVASLRRGAVMSLTQPRRFETTDFEKLCFRELLGHLPG